MSMFTIFHTSMNTLQLINAFFCVLNCNDKGLRQFLLKGGIYVLTLMDAYSGSYSLLFVCFCEVTGIAWFYGQCLHTIWNL